MDNCIKIASRASVLAKIQAKLVGERISQKHPNYEIEYHWIKTSGDLDQRLDISSGSTVGVFTSDISQRKSVVVRVVSSPEVTTILGSRRLISATTRSISSSDSI